MANSIKVVVNTGKQETTQTVDVLQGNGDAGQPTRIKAVKGARYQLEDPALKNTGPQHLRTKRIGKSLHITLDGSMESDLIIDDYYDEAFQGDGGGGIYGRAEDGSIYEYIPQDASQEGKLMELADGGSPVDQVLGADPVEDFELSALPLAAAAGGGLGIGGVAAGVAGAGALAGGGGGGAGTTATTAEADAALAAVKNFAENNGSGLTAATGTAPTEATYSTAGVTGVTTQNVGAINSALASAAVNGAKVDTVAKLQALVDAYRAILDEANGTAESGNRTSQRRQHTDHHTRATQSHHCSCSGELPSCAGCDQGSSRKQHRNLDQSKRRTIRGSGCGGCDPKQLGRDEQCAQQRSGQRSRSRHSR